MKKAKSYRDERRSGDDRRVTHDSDWLEQMGIADRRLQERRSVSPREATEYTLVAIIFSILVISFFTWIGLNLARFFFTLSGVL